MFCEPYNQSLTDVAAAGGELSLPLQRHLASCDSCRAAFAQEQSLFAAIDSGLRAAANSEVPATLIPRFHVALNNEPIPRRELQKWVFVGVALACALVVAIVLQPKHRETPVAVKTAATQTPPSSAPVGNSRPFIPSAVHEFPSLANKTNADPSPKDATTSITAEVLVPDEERAAFFEFLTRGQPLPVKSAITLAPEAPKELVPIPPVEIASLKVLPLDGEGGNPNKF